MGAEGRSLVTGDTYIFSVHIAPTNGRSRSIAVVFTPISNPSGTLLSNQLRDFFLTNPLSAELWLVAPTFAVARRPATAGPRRRRRSEDALACLRAPLDLSLCDFLDDLVNLCDAADAAEKRRTS